MVNNMEISRTNVYVADILLSLLATVAVIARFWVRKLRKARYGADDWTILASLMLMWALSAIIIRAAATGAFASHVLRDPETRLAIYDEKVKNTLKFHMMVWLFTIALVGLIKISVVLLYRRLFRVKRGFGIYSMFLMVLLVLWTVGFLFARGFQCGTKLSRVWTFTPDRLKLCYATNPISNGFMISDVITDLIVVLSPVPVVWKMHLPRPQKFAVMGIFAMGLLSTAAGCARAWMILNINYNIQPRMEQHDLIVEDTKIAVFAIIEIAIAILAACLPTLRPLVIGDYPSNLILKLRSSFSSISSMRRSSIRRSSELHTTATKAEVAVIDGREVKLHYIQVQEPDRTVTHQQYGEV